MIFGLTEMGGCNPDREKSGAIQVILGLCGGEVEVYYLKGII